MKQLLIDSLPALGTAWWIEISSPLSEAVTTELQWLLHTTISEFEARYSRFQPSSLISQLNTNRKLHSPDAAFVTLLRYGQELYTRTDTYFNFLIGEILSARGYDASYRFTATAEPKVLPNPLTALTITDSAITLHNGMVDIGGFGKGYLIDELAKILKRSEVAEFLINGGGDIYGSTLEGAPIPIYLEHPTLPKTFLGTTTLQNQGFAASSPFKRQWKHNEQTYNHIIGDTREGFASFVVADSARDADAFATAAMLMSDSEISELIKREPILVARYSPTSERLTHFNLPIEVL